MADAWRYIATRLNGDGTETFLEWDLPLISPVVSNQLSGPGGITGRLSPEIARLKVDGEPLFVPWQTAIYAEADGVIRGGGILVDLAEAGPNLVFDCVGFSGYAQGMPYTDVKAWIGVDPLDVYRHVWDHLQSQQFGDLGIEVDDTTSPMEIGTPKDNASDNDTNEDSASGPYLLSWYQTADLGGELDELARETPFDYVNHHTWSGSTIRHRIDLGYPRISKRQHGLRFVEGENVYVTPELDYEGDTYATEVLVLGSGEGRKMVRGRYTRPKQGTHRLRRAAVVTDKRIKSKSRADALAKAEVVARSGEVDLGELIVLDHPNAPIGSVNPGDEILIQTSGGWTDELALWCRVLRVTIEPGAGVYRLTVKRVDKVV